MKLDLDYIGIKKRIEKEFRGLKPFQWAKKVGVTKNVVSNYHGETATKDPSIPYIIRVAIATKRPVDYFLWGKADTEIDEHIQQAKYILQADHPVYTEAFKKNIVAFHTGLLAEVTPIKKTVKRN